jgi:hypothetical protein
MTLAATISAPTTNPVAAVLNLDDPAERFIVEVIQRFHGEDRLYRAHALRRTTNDKGQRVIVELPSSSATRQDGRLSTGIPTRSALSFGCARIGSMQTLSITPSH